MTESDGTEALKLNIKETHKKSKGKIACVTLGCAKNQVDSEVFLGTAVDAGYEVVNDLAEADYILVNTCGFLGDAMQEGVDAILNAADYKQEGKLKKLIMAGCMVSRYSLEELKSALPEVDAFLSTDDVLHLPDVLAGNPYTSDTKDFLYDHTMPRIISSGQHSAYVKIADGCNRPCAFCMIPIIKGAIRSRTSASVLAEIRDLGAQGVKEVNLIGQDLTAYGIDNGEINLAALLQKIDAQRSVPWIKLLYSYPVGVTDELLKAMVELPSICEYLDVPLQHSSEEVLKRMRRPIGKYASRPFVERVKSSYPQIHLRTTFIVGFPGETEEEFKDLENFVAEGHFDSVGVFVFSPEDRVPASSFPDQIPEEVQNERRERLMLTQQKVLEKKYQELIGKHFDVLIDGYHEETDLLLVGRTRFQAPEVDGSIIINDSDVEMDKLTAGKFVDVEITEVAGYDLVGKVGRIL